MLVRNVFSRECTEMYREMYRENKIILVCFSFLRSVILSWIRTAYKEAYFQTDFTENNDLVQHIT